MRGMLVLSVLVLVMLASHISANDTVEHLAKLSKLFYMHLCLYTVYDLYCLWLFKVKWHTGVLLYHEALVPPPPEQWSAIVPNINGYVLEILIVTQILLGGEGAALQPHSTQVYYGGTIIHSHYYFLLYTSVNMSCANIINIGILKGNIFGIWVKI